MQSFGPVVRRCRPAVTFETQLAHASCYARELFCLRICTTFADPVVESRPVLSRAKQCGFLRGFAIALGLFRP